ncbi:uncharacterized protein A4U43_C05F23660 [Asparagus officinalis]|uniref:Uncharacterized protein n=1 Tax=Asparagus officinalis TaxID=4686 RepID=A0A5P1EWH0_ASPOF|nr:uncharacterized protein A4U43_C05F23660 [Asparagus officinalis]
MPSPPWVSLRLLLPAALLPGLPTPRRLLGLHAQALRAPQEGGGGDREDTGQNAGSPQCPVAEERRGPGNGGRRFDSEDLKAARFRPLNILKLLRIHDDNAYPAAAAF